MTVPTPGLTPTPAPTATPGTPDDLDARIQRAVAAGNDGLRSEFGARMQALEGAVAALRTRPGEAPDEMAMREQANTMEEEAKGFDPKVLEKKEQAAALRNEGKTEEACKAEADGGEMAQKAASLRAQASAKRARAFGHGPIVAAIQAASAQLITDSEKRITDKLVTELGTMFKASQAELTTKRPASAAPFQGGLVPTPSPPPERASLSAAAMRLAGKFDHIFDEKTGGVTEMQLSAAMRDANVPIDDQFSLVSEFARTGLLRGR